VPTRVFEEAISLKLTAKKLLNKIDTRHRQIPVTAVASDI
jgi:hypothetical protein